MHESQLQFSNNNHQCHYNYNNLMAVGRKELLCLDLVHLIERGRPVRLENLIWSKSGREASLRIDIIFLGSWSKRESQSQSYFEKGMMFSK